MTGVEVVGWEQDGRTGHFAVHLRAVEIDDAGNVMHGPLKTHGIDVQSLRDLHGGKFSNFIKSKHSLTIQHHEACKQGGEELDELKGKILGIDRTGELTELVVSDQENASGAVPGEPEKLLP